MTTMALNIDDLRRENEELYRICKEFVSVKNSLCTGCVPEKRLCRRCFFTMSNEQPVV